MTELIVDNVVKEYDGVARRPHLPKNAEGFVWAARHERCGKNHPYENDLHRDCANVPGAIYFQGENILEMGARYRDKIGYRRRSSAIIRISA